jgi:SAM-dependent methyltransferase
MKIIDIVNRRSDPEPWSEGDNIPWNDPDFSQRMLKEHLTQEHDMASRKFDRIDQHVTWIHKYVLEGKAYKILDLGCGPGLYAQRLAKLGHQYTGIDYSPASIAHARSIISKERLDCIFQEADLREADFGSGFEAVMQIYGEINVFSPGDAALILRKALAALIPGGKLLLEVHTYEAVESWGKRALSWFSSTGGLFSETPHIHLQECCWDEAAKAATNRYFTIDAQNGEVAHFAQSIQAYSQRDYASLLEKCGYTNIEFYPSLNGKPDTEQAHLLVILARKPD